MKRGAAIVAALCFACFACNAGKGSPREPSTEATADPASSAVAAVVPGAAKEGAADEGDLVASASRKMMHDDGAGCLADLDRVSAVDPKLGARLALSRGQCEMLVGHCQAGKRRIAAYYVDETNVTPPRAEAMAETMAAMRCRGGDSTPRDELLRAIYELTDAAYANARDPAYCEARIGAIRRLGPVVTPLGPDDAQISGAPKALFHTGASCFARAGDCRSARAVYEANFPKEGLAAIADPAQRAKILESGFTGAIERCKGTK